MTERLKFIADSLSSPPFNKQLSLLSVERLDGLELLQLLMDIFCTLGNVAYFANSREEESVARLIELLTITRYDPIARQDLTQFRQDLLNGDKKLILSIVDWLLKHKEHAKQRLYLAKFLVPIQVPSDCAQDVEIQRLIIECEQLMEEFKKVHQSYEEVKKVAVENESLSLDIEAMEKEREIINRHLERLENEVQTIPNCKEKIEACQKLRNELERSAELVEFKQNLSVQLQTHDRKVKRLRHNVSLQKVECASETAEDILKRLEEEISVLIYMVNEKLPADLNERKSTLKRMTELEKLPDDSALCDQLKRQIQNVSDNLNVLRERRETDSGIRGAYSQSIVTKKVEKANLLQQCRRDLENVEGKLKRHSLKADSSLEQWNVNENSPSRENDDAALSADLEELRNERKLLTTLKENLIAILSESEISGVASFRDKSDEEQILLLEEVRNQLKILKATNEEKRAVTERLREDVKEMEEERNANRLQYDAQSATAELQYIGVEKEVHSLKRQLEIDKRKTIRLKNELDAYSPYVELLKNENDDKIRDQVEAKVAAIGVAEKEWKRLKDKCDELKMIEGRTKSIDNFWTTVQMLMRCKIKCIEEG